MRKAQIQSGETIMVLVIIGMLIFFGVIFMSNMQSESAEIRQAQQTDMSALAIASQLGNLPELRCTRRQTAVERCIDIYKAQAFNKYLAENQDYVIERFGNVNISIRIISPVLEGSDISVINITDPYDDQGDGRLPVHIPVVLNDPINKINYFSVLEVVRFT